MTHVLPNSQLLTRLENDIAGRKQTENALFQQKALFEAVFRDVQDAMCIANTKREILMCNPAMINTFGYQQEELIGQKTAILYETGDEFEQQGSERFNLSAVDKTKPCVVNYRRKNGEIFPGEMVDSIIKNESGEAVGFIGVIRDITERVQIDESSRDKAALEESYKELESFSYSIAHDLQTPLRAISGFSQILSDSAQSRLNDEEQKYLARIIAASNNMSVLIDDILDLSCLSRCDVQCTTVNMSLLANQIIRRLEESCPDRVVNREIQDNLIAAGDAQLIEVLLRNLIDNAWKYTRDKSPAQIEFGSTEINKQSVYYVRDNGVGFNMKYADKLFKPFHRLHSQSEFEGTGIGLATIHRIVQRHNGKVWAEAKENSGATFYFTFKNLTL